MCVLLTCALADDCALLEAVIDALDAVALAADQEATAQLGAWGASIEQGRRRVGEPALTARHTTQQQGSSLLTVHRHVSSLVLHVRLLI